MTSAPPPTNTTDAPLPRIAVVCAANGMNAGMFSVDLAAQAYLSSLPCRFEMFMAAPTRIDHDFGAGPMRLLSSPEQLAPFDVVLYWGDFLTNPIYARNDFTTMMIDRGICPDRAAAMAHWRRLMLPGDGVRPGQRIAAIGGNFQHDFPTLDLRLMADMEALATRFDLILPRDDFSLRNLARFFDFDRLGRVRPGLDPAFLLPPLRRRPVRGFSFAFARSQLHDPDALVPALPGLRALPVEGWLRLRPKGAAAQLLAWRQQIAASAFVLTDIYHLAVNALNMGVPVILLANDVDRQSGTLGDFKKHALMRTLGLDDWLVVAGEDQADLPARIEVLAARMVAQGRGRAQDFGLLDGLRARMRRDLDEFLRPAPALGIAAPPAPA